MQDKVSIITPSWNSEKYIEKTIESVQKQTYEQGSISLEQVEEYEHQYQVAVQKQEAAFKKVMLAVNDIEKAFGHGNPWLMKFRAISIPNKLERVHIKKWIDSVWVEEFEQVEVILKESQWKRFFPEEWLNNGEENYNGKKK